MAYANGYLQDQHDLMLALYRASATRASYAIIPNARRLLPSMLFPSMSVALWKSTFHQWTRSMVMFPRAQKKSGM